MISILAIAVQLHRRFSPAFWLLSCSAPCSASLSPNGRRGALAMEQWPIPSRGFS